MIRSKDVEIITTCVESQERLHIPCNHRPHIHHLIHHVDPTAQVKAYAKFGTPDQSYVDLLKQLPPPPYTKNKQPPPRYCVKTTKDLFRNNRYEPVHEPYASAYIKAKDDEIRQLKRRVLEEQNRNCIYERSKRELEHYMYNSGKKWTSDYMIINAFFSLVGWCNNTLNASRAFLPF